jgi:hypothetical protein
MELGLLQEELFEVVKNQQKDKISSLLTQLRSWAEVEACEETIAERKKVIECIEQLEKIVKESSTKGIERACDCIM